MNTRNTAKLRGRPVKRSSQTISEAMVKKITETVTETLSKRMNDMLSEFMSNQNAMEIDNSNVIPNNNSIEVQAEVHATNDEPEIEVRPHVTKVNLFSGLPKENAYDECVGPNRIRNPYPNYVYTKDLTKTDYKLIIKSRYDLWFDLLKAEMGRHQLLDIIDESVDCPASFSESEMKERISAARFLIINKIDEIYHNTVLNVEDPKVMLTMIMAQKRAEQNIGSAALRQTINTIRFKRETETVHEFNLKFDELIRRLGMIANAMSTEEIKDAYQNAMKFAFPTLETVIFSRGAVSYDELKLITAAMEASVKHHSSQEESSAMFVKSKQFHKGKSYKKKPYVRCYNCGGSGHKSGNCWNTRIKCYKCNKFEGHTAEFCPHSSQPYNQKYNTFKKYKFQNRGRKFQNGPYSKFQNLKYKYQGNQNNKKRPTVGEKLTSAVARMAISNESNSSLQPGNDKLFLVTWIVDSAASDHIVNERELFNNLNKESETRYIKSANNDEKSDILIDGVGELNLLFTSTEQTLFLNKVLYASKVSENLLSLKKLVEIGYQFYGDENELLVGKVNTNEILFSAQYKNNVWIVETKIFVNNYVNDLKKSKVTMLESEGVAYPVQTRSMVKKMKDSKNEVNETQPLKDNSANVNDINKTSDIDGIKPDLELLSDTDEIAELVKQSIKLGDESDDVRFKNLKENQGLFWHVRLGHPSLAYLQKLNKTYNLFKNVKFDESILNCDVCIRAKMTKLPYKDVRIKAEKPLYRIHTDIMGPIKPQSYPNKSSYIISFIDDYSRVSLTYCINKKSDATNCFKNFLITTRNELGENVPVRFLRCDNALEFIEGEFAQVCKDENITYDAVNPYTPEHNGVAERYNRKLAEKVRCLMFDSGLPKCLWHLAVAAATYLLNRTVNRSIDYKIPLQVFNPKLKLNLEHIRRFGCLAYAKLLTKPETKFSERAIRTVLVGYQKTGYILLHPNSGKLIRTKHVRFNEMKVYSDVFHKQNVIIKDDDNLNIDTTTWFLEKEGENTDQTNERVSNIQNGVEIKQNENYEKEHTAENKTKREIELKENNLKVICHHCRREQGEELKNNCHENEMEIENPIKIDLEKVLKECQNFKIKEQSDNGGENDSFIFCTLSQINDDPQTFSEATSRRDKREWLKAIEEELESMNKNKVWTLVPRSEPLENHKQIISSTWVFKRKLEGSGAIRHKARLVARGFQDNNYYEMSEIYAPVIGLPKIRAIFSIINKYNLEVKQCDVKTAFLNGTLETPVYMEIPDGLAQDENKVCRLEKALYGLRVSPRRWNIKFTETTKKLGLNNSVVDPCLFTWNEKGKIVFLVLYVDDILIVGNDETKMTQIQEKLEEEFELVDLGEPKNYLGFNIERDRQNNILKLGQQSYCETLLRRFGMDECKPVSTPMQTRSVLKKIEIESHQNETLKQCDKSIPYRAAIGGLRFLASNTRPDIEYAVNIVSRKQTNPTTHDWAQVKRVFRYLKGTKDIGLTFYSKKSDLALYSDASYKDCDITQRSTMGILIKLYGDTIFWVTKRQPRIAHSTCEAEYIALNAGYRELRANEGLVRAILNESLFPANAYCDNTATIKCTQMSGKAKLKHLIEKESHIIREAVEMNEIIVNWVESKNQVADILTKALPIQQFEYLREYILN